MTLNGSGSTASGGATFAWDVDNDGQFDDATGVTPTLTAVQLAALGLGDGPATATVSVRVTDGAASSVATAMLTVTNVAPIVSIPVAPSGVAAGVATSATFAADDPSAADDAAGFTYAIDWGDGTPVQSVTGGASVTVAHTWASDGTFTVAVTATDKDGATSTVATGTITVGSTAPPLPRTGSSTAAIFLVAAALVVLGALLAVGARFVPQRARGRRAR